MGKAEEITLVLPHITLAGRKWGNKENPVIIATHGWLDNASSFEPISALLDDYCVIAIDWPGHGLSDHRQKGYSLHITDYVLDLDLAVNEIKTKYSPDKIYLMSHSFGGLISVMYASLFPENVDKLVLLDILFPIHEAETNADNRLKQSVIQHRQALLSVPKLKAYPSVDAVARVRAKVTDLDFENAKLLMSRNLKQTEGGYVWRTDAKLKYNSAWRYSLAQITQLAGHIAVPALAIFGDKSSARLQLDKFQNHFEQLKFHIIDGGHHIHMDNPAQVSGLVRCFYAQS